MPKLGLGLGLTKGAGIAKYKDQYSLAFDGTNDFLQLGANFSSILSGNFTIIVWCEEAGSSTQVLFSAKNDTNEGVQLRQSSAGNVLLKLDATQKNHTSGVSAAWCMLAANYDDDSNEVNFWAGDVGGSLGTSNHTSVDISPTISENARIGKDANADSAHYTGNISDIAIYNANLTTANVTDIWNDGKGKNLKSAQGASSLQHWWRFGDGSADEVGTAVTGNGVVCDSAEVKPLGDELYTVENALSNLTSEADATSGLTTSGSITASQSSVVHGGSYAILSIATGDGGRFYDDLDDSGAVDLGAGKYYRISFAAKYAQGDSSKFVFSSGTNLTDNQTVVKAITSSETTFVVYTYFYEHSANTRYFGWIENGSNNNAGVYADSLSIKELTGEPAIMSGVQTAFATAVPSDDL